MQHLSAHRQRLLKVLPTRHIRCRSGILSKFSWELLHRLLQRDAAAEQPSCGRIIANPFHSLLVVTATQKLSMSTSQLQLQLRRVYPHKSHYVTWRIFQLIEQQHPSHPWAKTGHFLVSVCFCWIFCYQVMVNCWFGAFGGLESDWITLWKGIVTLQG